VFLADTRGDYLVAGGGAGASSTVAGDYPPRVAERLLSAEPSGSFAYGKLVYSYRHIQVPGVSNAPGERPFWTLFSVSPAESVFADEDQFAYGFADVLGAVFVLSAAVFCLVVALSRLIGKKP
jgi:hypothetical protein